MEEADAEAATSHSATAAPRRPPRLRGGAEEQIRVRRKTLEAVLEQCQRALELLKNADLDPDPDAVDADEEGKRREEEVWEEGLPLQSPAASDCETDELCQLLKSKVESPNFLEKLGSVHMSVAQTSHDDNSSWDMVSADDLWEDELVVGETESDQDDYVLVRQVDIVDGMACFMAAYLLSLEQTKELTPNQLQEALSKTFSVKKKKSRLQKAWNRSKVVYNVASWSATAVGVYQNPAILKAASVALWSSCGVISKLF
ncbi:uncharacterized protein LOC103710994 isoform X2 [Phoenix dactylifera]|uniref:Uncharacterized protein LOC103710994 isoform X2 n=1 Tax=Phoenix dactylifera TaxID=42345 RepID=A0A8B7CAR6_PHODC|nr:uncharacterized protein LOC103710994 isoform X2 [Phoenix dactylifera]